MSLSEAGDSSSLAAALHSFSIAATPASLAEQARMTACRSSDDCSDYGSQDADVLPLFRCPLSKVSLAAPGREISN